MTASPYSQPANGHVNGHGDSLGPLVSYAASYALSLGDADRVRATLLPQHQEAFDLAYLVQADRGDAPELEAERQIRLRTETAVYEAEAKRAAQDVLRERERRAILDGVGEAEAFAAGVLATGDLDSIPEPEPLVEGFLNQESLVRIFGPPKSYKSFVMLDIAGCVAAGIPWQRNKTVQSRVLYVVAEGLRGFRRRVRAWEKQNDRPMIGVDFYPKAVQIGATKEFRQLVAFVKAVGHRLIIFDTQARCTIGKEENSNTEMGLMVDSLDILKEATGACIVLVHHSGAQGGRARGATAILGALDGQFEVEADKDTMSLTLWTRAQKDLAEAKPVEMDLVTPGPGLSLAIKARFQGHRATAADLPPLPQLQRTVLGVVGSFGGAGGSVTVISSRLPDGTDRASVQEALGELLRKGCVKRQGATWFIDFRGTIYLRADAQLGDV